MEMDPNLMHSASFWKNLKKRIILIFFYYFIIRQRMSFFSDLDFSSNESLLPEIPFRPTHFTFNFSLFIFEFPVNQRQIFFFDFSVFKKIFEIFKSFLV